MSETGDEQEAGGTPPPAPAPRPERSWLRRALRAGAGGSLAFVLLVALVVAALHTPPGRTALRVLAERWGSRASGGTLRLGRLELSLFKGQATASAVSLTLPGTAIEVERIDLGWSPESGLRLALRHPSVVVRDTGEPPQQPEATGLAARPWGVLERFARARVVDGRLELRSAAGTAWLVLGGVDLELPERRHATLRVRDAAIGSPSGGLRLTGARGEAALALDDGVLAVERARVVAGGASLEMSGRLRRIGPVRATASAHTAFDGALVEALGAGKGLEGGVEIDASVELADDGLAGTLALSARALTVAGVGPWSVSGGGRFQGAQLVVDALTARGFGGRLEARGALGLVASAASDVTLKAQELDPAALARALAGASLPLSSRVAGRFRWTTRGVDVAAARGEGRIELRGGSGPGLRPEGVILVRTRGLTVQVAEARVEAHGARVTGAGEIDGTRQLRGRWALELPLEALPALAAEIGSSLPLPTAAGRVVAEGGIEGSLGEPLILGRAHSEELAIRGKPLALDAVVRYERGRVAVTPLVLRSGSGQATLTGAVPLAAASDWDLRGAIDSFEVEPALALLGLDGYGPLAGTLEVSGRRDAPLGRASLRGSARLRRPASATNAARADAEDVASAGEDEVGLALEATSRGRRLDVERLALETAGGRVLGSMSYDAASGALEIEAKAQDLACERLPLVPAAWRRVTGTLAGTLSASGTSAAPSGELGLTLADAALDGAALPALSLTARSDGRRLSVAGVASGPLLTGGARLDGDWPLRLEIDAAAVPLQALLAARPEAKEARATLAASGTIVVELPLKDPARLRYAGSDLALSGRYRRLEWHSSPFALHGDRDSLELEGLRLEAAGAWLAAQGRVALAPASRFDLRLDGELDLQALAPALPGRNLGGDGSLRLDVAGTGAAPDLSGELKLAGVRGRFEAARLGDLGLEARFTGRELRLERLEANLLGGRVSASGSVPLLGGGDATAARLAFALRDVDLARLVDRELREAADSPSLVVSLEGELRARAPSLAGLEASGRLTRLESRSLEGTLALARPAAFSLEKGALVVEPVRLDGPLGQLELRLGGRADGAAPQAEAELAGRIDLRALSPFLSGATLDGPATIDARLRYADAAFRLAGAVKLEGARLSLDALSFAASGIAGELRFEGDRARLEATGAAGDGRLHAKGSMRLGPSLLGPIELELSAERVPVNYPPGYRGRATGNFRLAGEPGRYRLSGAVSLSQGYYTAEVDTRSQSLERLDWQLAALDGGSLADQIGLDVSLRLAEPLRIRNSTMRLDVEGTVTGSGTLAQPTASGQLNLREGGELTLGRARVRVSQGRIELNGYPAAAPVLDFQGMSRVSGIALDIRARGALDDLQLTLDSDRSDLSQTDLVALLLTGRTAAEAASQGGVVVAEQLAVALGGVLQKGAGDTLLIDVSPDRSLLSDDTDPTQRLNIGTRITQNLTVVYSAALDGTEKRWIVEYNPGGGRLRFRAITEEDNSLSLEATDRLSFDLWSRRSRPATREREIERLAGLRFEGELPLAEDVLRGVAKLKRRRRYSALQREQAADRVRERLLREGYRAANVEALAQPAPGGVELVLRVEAGPLVAIGWSGDDPGGKAKHEAEQAWPAHAQSEVAAAAIARTALHRLQADGYYGASVEPRAVTADGSVNVELRVARGPQGTGVDVVFEGNQALDDARLLAALPKPGSHAFFEALDARSARITSELRLAYAGIGHLRVRIGAPRSSFDPASGRLAVTIPVRERAASSVAEVELPAEIREAVTPPSLKLAPGAPFDLAAYVADRDAIGAWYRAEGWTDAQVGAVIEPVGASVAVRYRVDAGGRPRVGAIRVEDAGRTRRSLIRRSLTVHEGDLVRPQALADSRERLSDTGIFRSVDVRAEPRAGDETVSDVVVGLVHKPDMQVEYGLRYTSAGQGGAAGDAPSTPDNGRIQVAGAVELSNPFGYGVKTRAYGFLTTERRTWGVSLDAATLAGLRVRTQLFVFDDSDQAIQISGFASRVRGTTLQQTRALLRDRSSRRWHDRLRLQWGYTFKDIEYVESAQQDLLLQGNRGFLSLAAIGDERDSLTDPTRGVFWTANGELARTGLGSDVNYVRLYGQLFAYVPLGRLVWAQGYRVGRVPGDNPLLLIENRFRAGGPTTVRGFEQNGLGPKTAEGDSLGGQAIAVFNQELRFPIWKSLKGGVFWDAGNVWLTSGELDLGDLRQSVGAGLRYMFPFGPVRVEYAWILARKPGEPQGRFVFGLGHAF